MPASAPTPDPEALSDSAATSDPEPAPAPPRRRHRVRRVVTAVVVVGLLGVTAGAVLLAVDAFSARSALTAAAGRVSTLQSGLADDADRATLAAELTALQQEAASARAHTDGPVWALAARLPVLGPNLDAVARIAAGLDDLVTDVVPPLVDTRLAVGDLERTADGGVDLAPLRDLAPRLAAAQAAVTATTASLAGIDPAELLPEVADPFVQVRARLADVAAAVATADRVAAVAPPMLGVDGPRTYLVLALTNAELRSGGGLPGAGLLVRADAGHVEVLRQVPGVEIGPFTTPVAELDAETAAIFTERPALFIQDVTLTPEFPTAAALAARMWALSQGEEVDGVVATDPVALAHLLEATGPVDVAAPDGDGTVGSSTVRLDAGNAVAILEHEVYSYGADSGAVADAFFGSVVAATVSRLESPDVSPAAVLKAVVAGAEQHRVQLWSAHPEEQARLAGTVVAGTFLSSPRAADAVGVFFDDTISGKMSWYLESSVTYVSSACTPAGRVDTIDVALTSTAPADAAAILPTYVAGWPNGTFVPGTVRTVVRVAGAVGSPAPQLERDGVVLGMDTHPLAGRSMGSGTIELYPGESTTVRIRALASASASTGGGLQPAGTLDLWSTPTAHDGGLRTVPVPVCGPSGNG
ncbi:hypothetical protein Xcel_3020 [Xylanimonas cellulosilytica DSM 15894]|uniref:DUF4012 domain-containing protein n=1 Tax=Xylanimonas cellulosilytica (strain DSM 15894 / JCM 12276 / CECT 5975 / KCTC 9989 / LMG 20990 / NBRC 107835 / XIL07) TaxID=446471 RepID=D1BZC9_XYLCX|nr:hypothetical protein Xcel_3020 [Xylanimonas cellulosilytica DSM 15894]